ncbi:MAG: hypothetical protein IIC84_01940 [Chloroflexi bacterium]|nr:hypothetical protein [Chloroflexota bacterium]
MGLFYAIDSNNLLTLDKDTYAVSIVGPLGITNTFGGLAYDKSTGTLYGISGSTDESLYSINTSTGAATFIGNYGIEDMFGLAYSPVTGRLLGSQSLDDGNLYSLNRSTGAATLIGGMGGPKIDGLAYHTKRQQLFGYESPNSGLWAIDEITGMATLVGIGSFLNITGFAYNSEDDILLVADFSGHVKEVDPDTGATTLVSISNKNITGLTFVPGPPPPCKTELNLSYGGGNLSIDLTIGTTQPAELNLYLAAMNSIFPLATGIPLPVIDPPFAVPTISFPLPPMGGVGALVTMTTPGGGIICADWDLVNTGSPLSKGIGELKELRNSLQSVDGLIPSR